MTELELGPKTRAQLKELTETLQLLTMALDKGNDNWDTTLSTELQDDTIVCCNSCDRDFSAGEKPVVREPGGDVYCLPCFNQKRLRVVKSGAEEKKISLVPTP